MPDAEALPLPTLLSQALVAFTIEADNALEAEMPHFTTAILKAARKTGQSVSGPWLVSLVMWANFLQFVDADGTTGADVQEPAGVTEDVLHTMLAGMLRWGYVTTSSQPGEVKRKPAERDLVIRPTRNGERARQIWRDLPARIEDRWRARYGADRVDGLRAALVELADGLEAGGPPFFPLVTYANGLRVKLPPEPRRGADTNLGLAGPLSKILLACTLRFEAEHELALAICANALRVVGTEGADLRDLPRLTGTSKEAVSFATGFLERRGFVTITAEGRAKQLALTALGRKSYDEYRRRIEHVEATITEQVGADLVARAREPLEWLAGDGDLADAPLAQAVAPLPGTWRASAPAPERLPHHPMVLHRGGYPDGS